MSRSRSARTSSRSAARIARREISWRTPRSSATNSGLPVDEQLELARAARSSMAEGQGERRQRAGVAPGGSSLRVARRARGVGRPVTDRDPPDRRRSLQGDSRRAGPDRVGGDPCQQPPDVVGFATGRERIEPTHEVVGRGLLAEAVDEHRRLECHQVAERREQRQPTEDVLTASVPPSPVREAAEQDQQRRDAERRRGGGSRRQAGTRCPGSMSGLAQERHGRHHLQDQEERQRGQQQREEWVRSGARGRRAIRR